MSKTFLKTVEDFECENCHHHVVGTGYTNHCPLCLYSKHVDVHPGDRAATCGGLMAPTAVEESHGEHVLVHTCRVCGHIKKNKMNSNDSFEKAIAIVTERALRP